jgi:G3E family GTPase
LLDLEARRIRGEAAFDRILIETSGLANPGSMLQSMMTDPQVAGGHRIDTVLTIADAVHGEHTLADHVEARMQVALADVILMSKLDVTPMSSTLHAAIQGLNQRAPVLPVRDAAIGTLFGRAPAERPGLVSERVNRGHSDVQTFTLMRDRPIPALALTLLLQAIAEHCGSRLLRLKGLVGIEEMPGQPAVIHGVHHVMSAPEFLDRWPTADETTRVVFIGMDIPRYFIPRLLDAIEDEVRSTTVL